MEPKASLKRSKSKTKATKSPKNNESGESNGDKNDYFKNLTTIECTGINSQKLFRPVRDIFYPVGSQLLLSVSNDDENILESFLAESKKVLSEVAHNNTAEVEDLTKLNSTQNMEVGNECSESPNTSNDEKMNVHQILYTEKGAVMLLDPNATVYLHGLLELTVIGGEIEILGMTLNKRNPTAPIFSPRGSAYLYIQNTNSTDINLKELTKTLKQFGLTEIPKFAEKTAIILCRNITDHKMKLVQANMSQILYPPEENRLRCSIKSAFNKDWNVLRKHEEWDDILNSVECPGRLMICGGKGVGKSTALRYMVNRLLVDLEEVLVIDLDPGQPEFTVPGCISLNRVTRPLLGPNFTHLQEPEKCVLVPNIDVGSDCENYLHAVIALLGSCVDLLRDADFTLINYMGFTKGVGINLVSAVISLVQPHYLVQIQDNRQSRNFPHILTPTNVKYYKNLFYDNDKSVGYSLFTIASMAVETSSWRFEARQVRELCILSYISQILPEDCEYITQKGVKIYRTKLSDVKIICNGEECNPKAANANIVALCIKSQLDDNMFNCLGWGVVRGICIERDILLLLTPISQDLLDTVEYLVVTTVNLPPSLYLHSDEKITGIVPYVYKGNLVNFAQTPKRAHHVKKL